MNHSIILFPYTRHDNACEYKYKAKKGRKQAGYQTKELRKEVGEIENEKIKAFVQHILQECEEEGFSIWEVERLPQALKFAIDDVTTAQIKKTMFTHRNLAK